MIMCRTALAVLVSCIGLSSGVAAAPVNFSYTSNMVTLGDFTEDWEIAWLRETNFGIPYGAQGRYAYIELEIDCTIAGGVWDCADEDTPSDFVLSDKNSLMSGGVRLLSTSDGTSNGLYDHIVNPSITVDASGQVTEWSFRGSETWASGDFHLSSAGDQWLWNIFDGAPAGYYYCEMVELVSYSDLTGTCANGVVPPAVDNRFALGTGTWVVDASAAPAQNMAVTSMPLPAGWGLGLTGIAVFGLMRRRRAYSM